MPSSVPALLVVMVFIDLLSAAVKLDSAALGAHIDFELLRRSPPFPAVIAVAKPIPFLAEQKREPPPWRHADEGKAGQRSANLCEGVHAHAAEHHGNCHQGINDRHI